MSTPFDKKIAAVADVQMGMDKRIIDEVVRNNEEAIKIQASQMFSGKLGTGQETSPSYTPFTRSIKRRKGQPSDRVTLRDTGDFQDDIVIDYGPDSFKYDSLDEKRTKLVNKYSEDIFGLNSQGIDELISVIRDGVVIGSQKQIMDA